jgi:hypothetical protein
MLEEDAGCWMLDASCFEGHGLSRQKASAGAARLFLTSNIQHLKLQRLALTKKL